MPVVEPEVVPEVLEVESVVAVVEPEVLDVELDVDSVLEVDPVVPKVPEELVVVPEVLDVEPEEVPGVVLVSLVLVVASVRGLDSEIVITVVPIVPELD